VKRAQLDFVVVHMRDIGKWQFFTSENFFHGKGSKTSEKADSRSKTANQCKVIRRARRRDDTRQVPCQVSARALARWIDDRMVE